MTTAIISVTIPEVANIGDVCMLLLERELPDGTRQPHPFALQDPQGFVMSGASDLSAWCLVMSRYEQRGPLIAFEEDGPWKIRVHCSAYTGPVARALVALHERTHQVMEVAETIGRHWRDQLGVNAALLDQLAEATAPDRKWSPPNPADEIVVPMTDVLDPIPELPNVWPGMRVLWNGREWIVATVNANPARGYFALEFTEHVHEGDEIMLRAAPEHVPSELAAPSHADGWRSLEPRSFGGGLPRAGLFAGIAVSNRGSDGEAITKARELYRKQEAMLDEAAHLVFSLGYTPHECQFVREHVSDLGERTVLCVRGEEAFELVTTPPSMPQHRGEDHEINITVTPRWLKMPNIVDPARIVKFTWLALSGFDRALHRMVMWTGETRRIYVVGINFNYWRNCPMGVEASKDLISFGERPDRADAVAVTMFAKEAAELEQLCRSIEGAP